LEVLFFSLREKMTYYPFYLIVFFQILTLVWGQSVCVVPNDSVVNGDMVVLGETSLVGDVTLEGALVSNNCSANLCTIKTDVDSLSDITSNGTFCTSSSCDTLNTIASGSYWPTFFHSRIDTGQANNYPGVAQSLDITVLFGDELTDRNNTYFPANGSFVANMDGYYQYGFTVVIDTLTITDGGGVSTVDLTCAISGPLVALDASVSLGSYTDSGILSVSASGILRLDHFNTAQIKCTITADNAADTVDNVHVADGNFHVLFVSAT
jgi:hypothetical protein